MRLLLKLLLVHLTKNIENNDLLMFPTTRFLFLGNIAAVNIAQRGISLGQQHRQLNLTEYIESHFLLPLNRVYNTKFVLYDSLVWELSKQMALETNAWNNALCYFIVHKVILMDLGLQTINRMWYNPTLGKTFPSTEGVITASIKIAELSTTKTNGVTDKYSSEWVIALKSTTRPVQPKNKPLCNEFSISLVTRKLKEAYNRSWTINMAKIASLKI